MDNRTPENRRPGRFPVVSPVFGRSTALPPPAAAVSDHETAVPGLRGPLRVCVVDPPRPEPDRAPTAIAALGFLAYPDAFEVQRFQVMSERLGWRIIVVQTPGFGNGACPLSHLQLRALTAGDFRPIAEVMIDAVRGPVPPSRPILLGYSMGASVSAAMARLLAEGGSESAPSRVILVEPVAVRRWTPGGLMRADRAEERCMDAYLALNDPLPWAVGPSGRGPDPGPSPRGRLIDLAAQAWGMSRGRLRSDLVRAVRAAPGLRVDLVHGEYSRFVRSEDMSALRALVHAAGGRCTTSEIPRGRHPMWQALPVAAQIAETLRTA